MFTITYHPLRIFIPLLAVVAVVGEQSHAQADDESRPNVLFIAVDDLRPSIGAYGDHLAVTPHLDALAESGVIFERAYCQQAVCSPSRTSLLTGLRPDSTGVYNLQTHFRENVPNVVTLPQYFRQHGYRTVSIGKIFHKGLDDLPSWDEVMEGYKQPNFVAPDFIQKQAVNSKHFPSYECYDVPDDAYTDGSIAAKAVAKLTELKNEKRPWFFAVGFHKPHLPFVAPSKYWDIYDCEELWPPPTRKQPQGAPEWAGHNNWELVSSGRYTDENSVQLQNPLPLELEKTLRHGYYACVSYADSLIGGLLATLEAEKLDQNTIVIVWGDHGYHVGDMGFWCKHNNYEWATHSPLIFRVPGKTAGLRVSSPVEFVDIYPTLVSLCGLPASSGAEGENLALLFDEPKARSKGYAFSQYDRNRGTDRMWGYSVRTDRFRYTEWIRQSDGRLRGRELYDFAVDPLQTRNHADNPKMRSVVKEHSELLNEAGKQVLELRSKRNS